LCIYLIFKRRLQYKEFQKKKEEETEICYRRVLRASVYLKVSKF